MLLEQSHATNNVVVASVVATVGTITATTNMIVTGARGLSVCNCWSLLNFRPKLVNLL